MKCNGNKNMSFKEKIELYLKYEEELIESQECLRESQEQLRKTQEYLRESQEQLKEIEDSIALKNEELSSLKNEILELEYFINGKFNSEFKKNCDYTVNIKNCYVISLNGKKYVTIRNSYVTNTGVYYYGSEFRLNNYDYYDALSTYEQNGKKQLRKLCGYAVSIRQVPIGIVPESEVHILQLCPELKMYEDGEVPNTHLKKIYYEINNLGAIDSFEKQNMSKVKK